MYKPKYELTFEGVTIDISRSVDSRETSITRQLCTTEFKSAVDTASFIVRYDPADLDLRSSIMGFIYSSLETLKDIKVHISLNDYSLFTGYLDLSELKLSSKRLPELISLTANDVSASLLDKKVDDYIFLEHQKISDIVKFLVLHAGGSFAANGMKFSDDRIIPVFAVDRENDDETYREYIDTLLFEAGGYVLDTDEEGWMSIVALPWEAYEPTRLIDDYQLDKGLETTRRIFNKNGLKVQWSTLKETDRNQRVWTSDFSRELEGKVLVGLDVPANGYYPEDGDISPSYQEFSADFLDREYITKQKREKNKDLSIIAVRDVSASLVTLDSNRKVMKNEDAWDLPILPSLKMVKNPTIYAKKAWYLLHNKTGNTVNLQLFTLEGRVLYRNKINYVTVPADADMLEEYVSTYIFTQEHAERFSRFYWHFLKNSSTIHKWSVLGDMSLGDVVQVSHKKSGVAQATLIVSATLKFVGNTSLVDCVGVALGPYNEYEVKTWGSSESAKPSAPAGADGETPIIEYRYSDSNTKPPLERGMWLFGGKPMMFGAATLNDADQGHWMKDPRPVPGKPYRWMRVSVDGGKTYQYSCITGKDGAAAKDFTIESSALTYNMGSRGEVSTPVAVELHINRINCPNSVCKWTIHPSSVASALEGDSITLNIPAGFKQEYIKVTATLPGVGDRKLAICGVIESLPKAMYLGVYPRYGSDGTVVIDKPDRTPVGPLITGDNIIYVFTEGEGEAKKEYQKSLRWNSATKAFEEVRASDSNYSEIMSSHIADVLRLPATVPSSSALFGYFGSLAAQAAFIDQLTSNDAFLAKLVSENVKVHEANVSDPSVGLYVQIATIGEDGLPVFVVKFNGKTLFQVAPQNGNVFFGEPNGSLTAPVTGFMYKPKLLDGTGGEIISPNEYVKIQHNGKIVTQDMSARGMVADYAKITNGEFGGTFNCGSIYAEPRSDSWAPPVHSEDNDKQCVDLYNGLNIPDNSPVRCKIDQIPKVRYISKELYKEPEYDDTYQHRIRFYDENKQLIPVKQLGYQVEPWYYENPEYIYARRGFGEIRLRTAMDVRLFLGSNILYMDIPVDPTNLSALEPGQVYTRSSDWIVRMKQRNL